MSQTPKEFFDQFPPLAPDKKAIWDANDSGQWCPRHWAPCPLLGANGIGAAMETMKRWLDTHHEVNGSAAAMNAKIAETIKEHGPLCCQLGDDVMYEIWGHWPPPTEGVAQA